MQYVAIAFAKSLIISVFPMPVSPFLNNIFGLPYYIQSVFVKKEKNTKSNL